MSAFVESTLAAALISLDRACAQEHDASAELQRWLLIAREQILAAREMVETERDIASVQERARIFARGLRPLRAVR
jgi:hypothetical protein